MAKNRKNQSAAIRFGPALKAFLLCLLLGGSGVGYVWQKNQIHQLGRQFREQEIILARLQNQNKQLRQQLTTLCSTPELEKRIRELNLGLVQPDPRQIQRLFEPSSSLPANPPEAGRQMVARQTLSSVMP
jgi:uncharacterized protein HemX